MKGYSAWLRWVLIFAMLAPVLTLAGLTGAFIEIAEVPPSASIAIMLGSTAYRGMT